MFNATENVIVYRYIAMYRCIAMNMSRCHLICLIIFIMLNRICDTPPLPYPHWETERQRDRNKAWSPIAMSHESIGYHLVLISHAHRWLLSYPNVCMPCCYWVTVSDCEGGRGTYWCYNTPGTGICWLWKSGSIVTWIHWGPGKKGGEGVK